MKTSFNYFNKCILLLCCMVSFLPSSALSKVHLNSSFKLIQNVVTEDSLFNQDDSTTFGFHFYQRNMLGEDDLLYKQLGTVKGDFNSDTTTLPTGLESYLPLIYLSNQPASAKASSYIKYVTGTKSEQIFKAGFNEGIFKNFLLNADYRNIVSPGFFQNQSTKIQNYTVGTGYLSRNKKYLITGNYAYSKLQSGENGGLENDSDLKSINNNQGNGLSVNLYDDKVVFKRKYIGFNQELKTGHKLKDSTINENHLINLKRIKQYTDYNREYYIYRSATLNDKFYNNSFIDSTLTYDSLYIARLINTLMFSFNLGRSANNSLLDLYYTNELVNYITIREKTPFVLHHAGAKFEYRGSEMNVLADYEFQYDDKLKNAYDGEIYVEKPFPGLIQNIFAEIETQQTFPSMISRSYYSNHFIWDNKFSHVSKNKVGVGLSFKKDLLKISASEEIVKNYIYYNSDGLPAQFDGTINLISSDLLSKIRFLKHWNIYNESTIKFTDNKNLFSVPSLTAYLSIYYEGSFFKNAMKASFGAGCLYFTSYFADEFIPATAQFRNQSENKIGNYPYLDIFTNFQIKAVKFFVKVEHVNMGLGKAQYFYLPHYPTPGRTLKIGVDWTLPEELKK